MKKEYRITGRIRKDEKRHVVDSSKKWNLQDAQKRLKQIELKEEYQRKNKKVKAIQSGMISVSTEYHSNYDLLELRIECRDVTPWETVG
ncbi:MAG TPA: hypothetical protein GXZ90_01960 [Clostridiales bacterium]|nr:hypothetical protein [Clostridiales bacterium]